MDPDFQLLQVRFSFINRIIFSLFVNDLDEHLNHEGVGVRVWDILIKLIMLYSKKGC